MRAQLVHANDDLLLRATINAVQAAGARLNSLFSVNSRVGDFPEIVTAIRRNDEASLAILRDALLAARPGAGWVEDELGTGALPRGEWWIVDPVEGNINQVHGMTDWCVTAALVRDNVPVLGVVYLPLTDETYTATLGGGAWLNGVLLRASAKTDLKAALVGTGQARPGEGDETYHRMGRSVTAMLQAGLVLRVSVPATLQLIHVAAGRMDLFWQFSSVRSGLVAGALLVREAGGTTTDTQGRPWSLTSDDFIAAATGVHAAAIDVLSTIS